MSKANKNALEPNSTRLNVTGWTEDSDVARISYAGPLGGLATPLNQNKKPRQNREDSRPSGLELRRQPARPEGLEPPTF